ncbi:MAG: response regulator [Planctomycetota bacterium]
MARILIADASGERAIALRALLAAENHKAAVVESPESFEAALKDGSPDVVLLLGSFGGDPAAVERKAIELAPRATIRRMSAAAGSLIEDPLASEELVSGMIDIVGLFASCAGPERREGPWPVGLPRLSGYARKVAERMGIPKRASDEAALAGALLSACRAWERRLGAVRREDADAFQKAFLARVGDLRLSLGAADLVKSAMSEKPDGIAPAAHAVRAADRFLLEEARGWGGDEIRLSLRERSGVSLDPFAAEALISILVEEKFIPAVPDRGAVILGETCPDHVARITLRLRNDGFAVRAFSDGEALLAAAREAAPKAIVCDARLPKKDAFEVLVGLRKDPKVEAPFFILSNRLDEFLKGKAKALGARRALLKPLDLVAFGAAIDEALAPTSADSSPSDAQKKEGDSLETESISI